MIKIGHRGAMGYEKENTLASFEKAIELGADMIELDVHSKDGLIYVVHDIENMDDSTPLLEEVFDLVRKRAGLNIELKGENTAEPVAFLIKKYIKRGWKEENILVSSFNLEELKRFKKSLPSIRIGVLIKKDKGGWLEFAKNVGAFSINISLKIASRIIIELIHSQGLKAIAWTVNKEKDIKRIKEFRIDGIISDYPERL